MSRPGAARRQDANRRALTYGAPSLVDAPFYTRLIHANYADRDILYASQKAAAWGDVVGNRDFVQADTSKQPAESTFTTKDALLFDGVNDFMATGAAVSFAGRPTITIAMALRTTGAGSQMVYETSASAGANPGAFYVFQDTASTLQLAFKNTVGVPLKNIGSVAAGVHRVVFVLDSTVAATVFPRTYFDGASLGAGAGVSDIVLQNFVHYIGMRAGTSLPWGGKMGDMLVYGDALSDAECVIVDAFLASRAT
jgi:hypothetical protein